MRFHLQIQQVVDHPLVHLEEDNLEVHQGVVNQEALQGAVSQEVPQEEVHLKVLLVEERQQVHLAQPMVAVVEELLSQWPQQPEVEVHQDEAQLVEVVVEAQQLKQRSGQQNQ